jgi:hypothetical protein
METYLGSDPRLQCLRCAGLLFCSAPGTQIIFFNVFNISHFFFFFAVLGLDTTILAMPLALFAVVIFQIGSQDFIPNLP